MEAVTTARRMSADAFLAHEWGERPRLQLIDGAVVVNEPSWMHNGRQLAIAVALGIWVRGAPLRGCAGLPLDIALDARNVYAPDVVWYREGRAPVRDDPPPYAPPDIAVEVRSPSTWRYDIGVKKAIYERYGVAELWLVDTDADVVLVFRRSSATAPTFDVSEELDEGAILSSSLLPGFALPVAEIFGA